MIRQLFNKLTRRQFSYDAVNTKSSRRPKTTVIQSEDRALNKEKRKILTASIQDIRRNFEVAAWMVRTHANYVASFKFRATSESTAWNRVCEGLVREWSKAENFDATGRHNLRNAMLLSEKLRTTGGDLGWVKLVDGRIQIMESDRIAGCPPDVDPIDWVHGVKLSASGKATAYCVNRRVGDRLEFERVIPASRIFVHGYFDRYDQVRGISPLAQSLNRLTDLYENIDYALAKSKVLQLFGLAVYKASPKIDDYDDEDLDDDDADTQQDVFKLNPEGGPFTIHMTPEERAEFLSVDSPGVSFIEFNHVCIELALKCLDMPYSLFSEGKLTWHGSKTAQAQYKKACLPKIADNEELLVKWMRWRLGLAIASGEVDPRQHGVSIDDALNQFRWVSCGTPWFDKSREVAGDLLAVKAGFQTLGDVIEERLGEDYRDTFARAAEEQRLAKELGLNFETVVEAVDTPDDEDTDE